MKPLYLSYGAIISPFGSGMKTHFEAFMKGQSGIVQVPNSGFNSENWYLGKIDGLSENRYNDLLRLICNEIKKELTYIDFKSDSTAIIISTTKANLQEIAGDSFDSTRRIIQEIFEPANELMIISNACISGVVAINTAADILRNSETQNVVVIGIDALHDFIVYGFQSLFALSDLPGKPFDSQRKGISLGEAAGAVLLSKEKPAKFSVTYLGGASSNDANHISGPSRTGEGLFRAVERTLKRTSVAANQIDFISAHGTATIFNDEMESIAFGRLGMDQIPLNSFKGYFGHTLGAAGVIEVLMCMLSMEKGVLFNSLGFDETGTSVSLNIVKENTELLPNYVLKTASGFGGGNAVLLLKRSE